LFELRKDEEKKIGKNRGQKSMEKVYVFSCLELGKKSKAK